MHNTLLFQWGVPLLAAAALAWIAVGILQSVRFESSAAKHLRAYGGDAAQPAAMEAIGSRIASRSPVSLAPWEDHLRWARRGGSYTDTGLGQVVINALLLAGAGCLVLVARPAPAFLPIPLIGLALPFIRLRGKANAVRRQVVRSLPEIAALVAAEISAGSPPEQALLRAAGLPGPLSGLLGEAVAFSRQTGRPIFSRKPVRGALVETFAGTALPPLRAFALQVDEVAGKGVDSAALMNDVANSLAREYRNRVMTEKEKLGGRLTTAVAFFFFFPAVVLILAAFLVPMIQMF